MTTDKGAVRSKYLFKERLAAKTTQEQQGCRPICCPSSLTTRTGGEGAAEKATVVKKERFSERTEPLLMQICR
ncbi:MAG: hypothetical protein J6K76_01275 [Spirochaetaceae bacterium]|nr:hypothetical protein [Spirochaetaceae bacterium]